MRYRPVHAVRRLHVGRRLAVAACGTVAIVAAGVCCSVPSALAQAGTAPAPAVTAAPVASCPAGVSQCVSVTIPCSTSACPVVTAGPTENLGDGQYVYLSLTGVPAGQMARIAFCPETDPPTIGTNPSCAYGVDAQETSLTQVSVPVSTRGKLGASFPTLFDPSGQGNAPITAKPLISTLPADPATDSFYCDDDPDLCGLDVELYPAGFPATPLGSANTAVVPLEFAPQSSGCPQSDPLVFSDSSFSMEHFIPAAVDSTCAASSGVADVDTATNTGQVVSDFAAGGTTLAFTDAPQDPAEIAGLKSGTYRLVPVAVSATVVAFLGGDYETYPIQEAFPISSYNLTPNMVAGLITSDYSAPYGSDVLMPPLKCSEIKGCTAGAQPAYDAFDLLNPVSSPVHGPQRFGAFFSSVDTGASYQVTDWACHAPNRPFTVTVPIREGSVGVPTKVVVKDRNRAAKTMTTPPLGLAWPPPNDPTAPWPYQACQAYSTLPVLSASSSQYSFAETQALQATALRNFAYGGGGAPATTSGGQTSAGFGAMDWSEASYFGLNTAHLQNAAGKFVAPSAAAVDEALEGASPAPDGVLQYNYDFHGAGAYPMPLVTYALVSTTAQTPAAAQAEGDLLTNLVCYSHFGGKVALPTGYVPLPTNLYDQARTEIAKTFPYTETSCNGPTPALPPSGGSKHKGSPGKSSGSHPSGGGTTAPKTGGGSTTPTPPKHTAPGSTTTSVPKSPATTPTTTPPTVPPTTRPAVTAPARHRSGPVTFAPTLAAVAAGVERWILPGLVGGALLGLLLGPLVAVAGRLRRRPRRAGPAGSPS